MSWFFVVVIALGILGWVLILMGIVSALAWTVTKIGSKVRNR